MSTQSRKEYMNTMSQRYRRVKTRNEKSMIFDKMVRVLECHRKYAIQVLKSPPSLLKSKSNRQREYLYKESLPVIQIVWKATSVD